jgi:predicted peptidase
MIMKQLPSEIEERVLQPGGHRYTIALPRGDSGATSVPLVLALHYSGHGTPFYGRYMLVDLVEPALRELGAVVVAPDCPDRDWARPHSVEVIHRLMDAIETQYAIDGRKTLAVGYSMGGAGVWHLARHTPERFAAAVVMAGRPPDGLGEEWLRIPVYVIHSRADDVVPIGPTERIVSVLRERGSEVEFVTMDDVTHFETTRFVGVLEQAVPWVKRVWARRDNDSQK